MRIVALLVLVLSATLAGCTNGGTPESQEPNPEAFDNVQVTDDTGAIRGIVFDDSITPIEGVLVSLVNGANKTTDKDGAFVFNTLAPGDYFLQASKAGYLGVQQSVTVVAGQKDPPITKIKLAIDVENQPYAELLQWTGFFGCGFGTNGGGLRSTGVNPCAADALVCDVAGVCLLNTANTHTFNFGGSSVPDFAQAEMLWEGTQSFGNSLNLGWHDEGTSDFKSISGESPLILPTNRTEILAAHEDTIDNLLVRVFPGTGSELTVTLQQRFDVYVTYFYGFEPREGWAFALDGPCSTPQQCGA